MYICFMISCLFYIVLLHKPFGCKNPINDDNDVSAVCPAAGIGSSGLLVHLSSTELPLLLLHMTIERGF